MKKYGNCASAVNNFLFFESLVYLLGYTLTPRMFGVGCFWLETTIIIKIESHLFYPIICA
jgi:hypothetical protein